MSEYKIIRSNLTGERSPAVADFYEQTITVNEPVMNRYDDFTRRFILNHERGHLALNTHDEFAADEFAFNAVAGSEPYSLRRSVNAITETLPFDRQQHYDRLQRQIRRALAWDAAHGNAAAAACLKDMDIDRYARYTTYQDSDWEAYQHGRIMYMNDYSLNKLEKGYSLSGSTIGLLCVFIAGIVLVAFALKKTN